MAIAPTLGEKVRDSKFLESRQSGEVDMGRGERQKGVTEGVVTAPNVYLCGDEPCRMEANNPLRRLPLVLLDTIGRPSCGFWVPGTHLGGGIRKHVTDHDSTFPDFQNLRANKTLPWGYDSALCSTPQYVLRNVS